MAKLKPRLEGKSLEKTVNPDGSITYKRQYEGMANAPKDGLDIDIPGGIIPGSRDEAFAKARSEGLPSYEYEGMKYTTEIAPMAKSISEERVSTVPAEMQGKGIPEQMGLVEPTGVAPLTPRRGAKPQHETVDYISKSSVNRDFDTMDMYRGDINPHKVRQRDALKSIFDREATPESMSTESGTRKLVKKVNKEFKNTYEQSENERFLGKLRFTGRGLK